MEKKKKEYRWTDEEVEENRKKIKEEEIMKKRT